MLATVYSILITCFPFLLSDEVKITKYITKPKLSVSRDRRPLNTAVGILITKEKGGMKFLTGQF